MTNNTITVNLVNNTNFTFVFNRITVNNPGNTLIFNKKILSPEQTGIITGTTDDTDLSGSIYFNDKSVFDIFVPLQFHYRQPVFEMNTKYIFSTVESRVFNPTVGPKLLMYTKATISLKNR